MLLIADTVLLSLVITRELGAKMAYHFPLNSRSPIRIIEFFEAALLSCVSDWAGIRGLTVSWQHIVGFDLNIHMI